MGQPRPLFDNFSLFVHKLFMASRIRTQIVGVKGKNSTHSTTTITAQYPKKVCLFHDGQMLKLVYATTPKILWEVPAHFFLLRNFL